jgi:branched-chain amino acid transport system substrate-binding protein
MRARARQGALAGAVLGALAGASLAAASPAWAADKITIGFVATLSGPGAVSGIPVRDGLQIALDELGGKLGGVPASLLVEDDQQKPEIGRQIAEKFMLSDKADVIIAGGYSNVLLALYGPVVKSGTVLISANPGPSQIAGKECSPYFFSTSWQGDNFAEAMGAHLQEQGVQEAYLMAPNYAAGHDVLTGFKRTFKGKIVGETYTPLAQLDFAAELAEVRASNTHALFVFYPGGLGIQFIKQWAQSGLGSKVTLTTAYTIDNTTLPAIGESALGQQLAAFWNTDMKNPANEKFVAEYRARFHADPSGYAAQGYDAGKLLDSAVRAVGGKIEDKPAFLAAMAKADFASVRGKFAFANDHFPIQDFYLGQVVRGSDGQPTIKLGDVVLKQYSNAYTESCPMK